MYKHTFEHQIGDIVYLKTDQDQEMYIVCSRTDSGGKNLYQLAHGGKSCHAYAFEISEDKDLSLYYNNN